MGGYSAHFSWPCALLYPRFMALLYPRFMALWPVDPPEPETHAFHPGLDLEVAPETHTLPCKVLSLSALYFITGLNFKAELKYDPHRFYVLPHL